jgi:hypothetical protein
MNTPTSTPTSSLTLEIAAEAARLVADHGLDYGAAKKKACANALATAGISSAPRDAMPTNTQIDDALFEHFELFDEHHQGRVARMRSTALAMMQILSEFSPMLTGSVWKGIVAEHVPIHIQVFSDNHKELLFALLNEHIDYDATEMPHFRTAEPVQALTFHWRNEPIMIVLYLSDDLRGAVKEKFQGGRLNGIAKRGDIAALAALIGAQS